MSKSKQSIEKQLQTSFSHAVPDKKQEILRRCMDESGRESSVIPMDLRAKKRRKPILGNIVAAAAVLLLALQFGFYQNREISQQRVETVIDLDVNPSIELSVNADDRIVDVLAVNADAASVMEDMDLKGTQTKVAVNAIIGAMLSKGYLSEDANSILISVDNKDEQKSVEIQETLVQNIDDMLTACSVDAAILSQSVATDDAVSKAAADYEISAGRMSLINKIIEMNSAYTVQDLVSLTVNELNLLISAQDNVPESVSTKGTVSQAAYIGIDKAIEIALADQQLSLDTVIGLETEITILNSRMVYSVSYLVNNERYVYKVDALNGTMANFEILDGETGVDGFNEESELIDGENTLPDTVSDNSVSDSSLSDNSVSDNSLSENTVSDNEVDAGGEAENAAGADNTSEAEASPGPDNTGEATSSAEPDSTPSPEVSQRPEDNAGTDIDDQNEGFLTNPVAEP